MASSYAQVLLFGDSLVQYASKTDNGFSFQSALQERVMRRYDVVNRGFNGYNTNQMLRILPEVIPAPSKTGPQLAYFVVLLGANDAALPMAVNNQHVPLAEYEANLKAILTHPHIRDRVPPPKTLLITPPPIDVNRRAEFERLLHGNAVERDAHTTAKYAEAARRVAKEVPGTILVDLNKELVEEATKKTPNFKGTLVGEKTAERSYLTTLLPDGLHLGADAYRTLFELVKPHIDDTETQRDKWIYPEWQVAPWLKK